MLRGMFVVFFKKVQVNSLNYIVLLKMIFITLTKLNFMKKAILLLLVAIAFCSSCKKDQKKGTVTPAKTYKLNLHIADFTQTIENSSSKQVQASGLKTNAATPAAGYLDQLYFYIYHSDGAQQLVHTLVQDSTYSNFGNISVSESPGSYTIIIGAGKPGLASSLSKKGLDLQYLKSSNYFYYPGGPFAQWKDTFYGQLNITINGDINQDINLSRIVAQLQIKITDAIPAAASTISVTIDSDYLNYTLYYQKPDAITKVVYNTAIPAAAKGKTNFTFNNLIGNTITPFSAKIVCYDAAKNVLGTALVNNIICQQNKRTILTGALFGSQNNFTVSLNDTWNATPINATF